MNINSWRAYFGITMFSSWKKFNLITICKIIMHLPTYRTCQVWIVGPVWTRLHIIKKKMQNLPIVGEGDTAQTSSDPALTPPPPSSIASLPHKVSCSKFATLPNLQLCYTWWWMDADFLLTPKIVCSLQHCQWLLRIIVKMDIIICEQKYVFKFNTINVL